MPQEVRRGHVIATPLLLNRGGVLRRGFIQTQDIDPNEALPLAKALGGTALLWDSVNAGVTLPSASITTSTLDQGFAHLLVIAYLRSSRAALDTLQLRVSGVSSASYDWQTNRAENTTFIGSAANLQTSWAAGWMSQNNGFTAPTVLFLPGYTLAAHKSFVGFTFGEVNSTPLFDLGTFGGVISTGAITSLTFFPSVGPNIQDGRISVYGVAT